MSCDDVADLLTDSSKTLSHCFMEQVWKEWAHFWLGPLPAFQSSLSPVVITRQGEIVKEKASRFQRSQDRLGQHYPASLCFPGLAS